jgi:hypothetical protein
VSWDQRFSEPIELPKGKKPERSTDVRFGAHPGLKSDITALPRMGWTGRAPAQNRSENERGA